MFLSESGSSPNKIDPRTHQKVLFSLNLYQLIVFSWTFFTCRDVFFLSCFQLPLTEELGKHNLFTEQANLFFPSFVDWLCNGREAGDKRKVQKERFIWLSALHSCLLSFSWEADSELLPDYPNVCDSLCQHSSSLAPSLCLLLPWEALIPGFRRFLRLLHLSGFCFEAFIFHWSAMKENETLPVHCWPARVWMVNTLEVLGANKCVSC